jgi:glycosyltransferase involved in cell wall biosynthesis
MSDSIDPYRAPAAARMIFYHPRPIPERPQAGSDVHVVGTLRGFHALDIEVEVVAGDSRDRIEAMTSVRRAIEHGKKFDFLYGSLTTAPIALNDSHHMPRHPFADLRFFRFLRNRNVPIGLFYPDVFWKFDTYRDSVAVFKRVGAVAAYRAELLAFRRLIDVLFVPSLLMAEHVPSWSGDPRLRQLLPGCTPRDIAWPQDSQILELFYVGAITPPIYDIRPLVAAVAAVDNVHLTVCCPPREAKHVSDWPSCDRVTVVHASGEALETYYERAHVACLFFADDEYRKFAMPVKLFEYIGMGRPILASGTDVAGEFVAAAGLGWSPAPSDLVDVLRRLAANPSEVVERRHAVVAAQKQHGWAVRAKQIAETLLR